MAPVGVATERPEAGIMAIFIDAGASMSSVFQVLPKPLKSAFEVAVIGCARVSHTFI